MPEPLICELCGVTLTASAPMTITYSKSLFPGCPGSAPARFTAAVCEKCAHVYLRALKQCKEDDDA